MSQPLLLQIATSIFTSGMFCDENVSFHEHRTRMRMALALAQDVIEANAKTNAKQATLAASHKPKRQPRSTITGIQVKVVPREIFDEHKDGLERSLLNHDLQGSVDAEANSDTDVYGSTPNSSDAKPTLH